MNDNVLYHAQYATANIPGVCLPANGVYDSVRRYLIALGLNIGAHALRTTAGTNALDHDGRYRQGWLATSVATLPIASENIA